MVLGSQIWEILGNYIIPTTYSSPELSRLHLQLWLRAVVSKDADTGTGDGERYHLSWESSFSP